MPPKKLVLITGCSDGGLGSALALAFHAHGGYRVIATARNQSKLAETRKAGIEDLELDVLSEASIAACVEKVKEMNEGCLDMLLNNAGAGYNMPVLDTDLNEARKMFDLNVWSLISVTKAFVPLLLQSSDPKIVNNVSIAAYVVLPFQGAYNASKAAANTLTENLRLELKPFGIKVVALITGTVRSNFYQNMARSSGDEGGLPEDSIFKVVPGGLSMMKGEASTLIEAGTPAADWAIAVVQDLSKATPPHQIWRGTSAASVRLGSLFPTGFFDKQIVKISKMNEVDEALKQRRKS